jgi:hypothetical protein
MQIRENFVNSLIDKYNELWRTDIRSKRRDRKLVLARQCFFYILRTQYRMRYQEIANIFDKNHASVIHGERVIRDMIYIGDRDTEDTLQTVVDVFRLHSLDIKSYVSPKSVMLDELEKMVKAMRILDEVDPQEIKRIVDNVWKAQPSEVA